MKTLNQKFALCLFAWVFFSGLNTMAQTYCNPLNISYRFSIETPMRREAADPTMVVFKDTFYLFASKSGGFWYSADMYNWTLQKYNGLSSTSVENYAPTATVIGDYIYFRANGDPVTYRTNNPINGTWEVVTSAFNILDWDPAILADDDGKVYYYYGCSNTKPLGVVELDPENKYLPKGNSKSTLKGKPLEHGWERPGDYNNSPNGPWIEGSWINKINGKYYLQYSGPGTEFKSYSDGVYVSDSAMGPYTYAENNPFSYKPEGFIAGAGHGSTFMDKYGNYWHIASMSISVKHMFERRLGIFPVGIDKDGIMYSNNAYGDYPMIIPDHKMSDLSEVNTGWMLLTLNKKTEASSTLDTFSANLASDENIRTYWSAKTKDKGEWFTVDLDTVCSVRAIQVNLAEHNINMKGRDSVKAFQFLVEYSTDKTNWSTMWDKTTNEEDLTHQFLVLDSVVKARYIKVTNYRVPSGTFAISDLRVFGTGKSGKPGKVSNLNIVRESIDKRVARLTWSKQNKATGYMVYFGHQADKLYHSYQVYSDTSLTINSLNIDQNYWFRVDAFGEDGITKGDTVETTFIQHSVIEAEYFGGQSGIKVENCSEGGKDVTSIEDGDYIYFDVIDFGNISKLDLRVASAVKVGTEAGSIEIRANSADGVLLGTAKVTGTGNAQVWQTVTCDISGTTGIEKIYLVFRNKGYAINWIEAKGLKVSVKQSKIDNKYSLHYKNNNQLLINGIYNSADVNVWNVSGQIVMNLKTSGMVDVSELAEGMYFVQVDKETSLKFIK